MEYIVKGNFYCDIDLQNQLRITGPGNHLLCGLTFPTDVDVSIASYDLIEDQLFVKIKTLSETIKINAPLVTDIRTLRNETEPVIPTPTYRELSSQENSQVNADKIELVSSETGTTLRTTNSYMDDKSYTYGCELFFEKTFQVAQENNLIIISGRVPITFNIITISNIALETLNQKSLFTFEAPSNITRLDPFMYKLYEKMGREIDHLVRTKKTSSFEYGTIFPRDWIEAADLGEDDFTQETVDYMYEQSMKYVSDKGEGWHEEIIGQYKTKTQVRSNLVDRKMIDIEPHYILGLDRLSNNFLAREDIKSKFVAIAKFILHNAKEQELISFKRLPNYDGYYLVGNWRDSEQAFINQKSPLSPYDVNCVFYPEALRQIKTYSKYLEISHDASIDKLIQKWDRNKQKYRLFHDKDTLGYSLALHGKKNLPIPVAHLDESYDLFYNRPSIEEVDSFARKVIDPDYFFTPAGPILVDADAPEYSTRQYHGKVIWPKQVGFVVAGLARQYKYGIKNQWPQIILEHIVNAILITAQSSINAWKTLKLVPELYYYDSQSQTAKLYTDQENYEGQMSLVQLWSAVSARRIIREYLRFFDYQSERVTMNYASKIL